MQNRKFIFNLFQTLFCFVSLAGVLAAAFPVSGQTRRGVQRTTPAAPGKTNVPVSNKQAPTRCNGGWTGVITFQKTLNESSDRTEKNIGGGTTQHVAGRDYNYTGRIFADGSNASAIQTRAQFSLSDKDDKFKRTVKRDTCFYDRKGLRDQWTETVEKWETNGNGAGEPTFWMSVNEQSGTYGFSFRFPEGKGAEARETKNTAGGWCNARLNEPSERKSNSPLRVDREGAEIKDQKIDPENPDVLSGTKTWDTSSVTIKSFVYTVTWYFTRCPQRLLITDLKFEHPKFPKWDDWQEIVAPDGTVDGNPVKVKAKVLNLSNEPKFVEVFFKETYKGDKWDGAKPDSPLNDNTFSLRLDPGEEREVETLWNTQGYAWYDDGRPRYVQRVKAEAWENSKKQDEMMKNLKVAPKPIIFVPGVSTNRQDFEIYQNLLTVSHSYGWKTYPVIDTSGQGTIAGEGTVRQTKENKSVYDNADNLTQYVNNVRSASNAWHVDMLAHSTGGLVARLYVHKQMEILPDNLPVVKHLMMLGVPNNGVPCADSIMNKDAFKNNTQTAKELTPEEMKLFNQYVTNRKGTKFSALIGNSFPLLCAGPEWNDGFVSVESAKYGVADYAFTKAMHADLISTKSFNDFIKPHIVTGPRGTYPLPVVSEKGGNDGRSVAGN